MDLDPVSNPEKGSEANESSQPAPMVGSERGQVAQVVERSPEKAGVGGSTPSLATKSLGFNSLPIILNPIHRGNIL